MGHVTLPGHEGNATKALVIMLAGVCTRWKQTVGYWFTSNSCDGKVFCSIINDIIAESHKIGLHVITVTNDMGGSNLAMWKHFGVKIGKNSEWKTTISHPSLPDEELYFIADDPHLVKNIKAALCNGNDFLIPGEFVSKHDLPSFTATIDHIKQLLKFDAQHQLKLVPGLYLNDLDPAHFDKMNVGKALRFILRATSGACSFLLRHMDFLRSSKQQLGFWKLFVSGLISFHPAFLKSIVQLFLSLKIGVKGSWKPIQTGVVTTTKSIIGLQDFLLNKKGFKYVLTSRFSQDALENLFSQVRLKNPVPTAKEFKTNLRAITIAQYLTEKKDSNYQNDESEYLADFLNQSKPKTDAKKSPKLFLSSEITTDETINKKEISVLKYIAGHTVFKVKKSTMTCDSCLGKVINSNPSSETSSFTKFRDYTGHSLYILCYRRSI